MYDRRVCPRILSVLLALFCVAGAVGRIAAAESAGDPVAGPLLVAQAAEKPQPDKYELRYKFQRGEVLRYDVSHRASLRSTIDQTTQAAQTRTDSLKVWKVTDVLPNGELEFNNVVERVHMVNQLPDKNPTEYDSTRDKTPPAGFEDAAKAVGVPLSTIRITPAGKIVRHDLKLRGQADDDDAPIVLRLPEQAVAIGDTWDEPYDVRVLLENKNTKIVETRRHHRLADVKNGIATISVEYQVLSPIDSYAESQLVQRLMSGEVRFDIKAGRVVSQKMEVDKRILGFAGATSSMQYVMRMEEKLSTEKPTIAATSKPNGSGAKTKTGATAKNNNSATAQRRSTNNTRTASRPKTATQKGTKTQQR
jgi:hypothetical protein